MEGQVLTQPGTRRVPLDEKVRTCRPAILSQARIARADEEKSADPDWNIIRGED
ncbi:hypothetical protein PUR59_01910 [Streptomyces sp. SP18ES09]|uniref:hypothetical protein n=1 Tax=Streptomyces sp. SP18ES09 TaxID=3002532 RepID=UPI002E765E96|nr:hypothetical protein [Streptomyces sp. SP18ES09]MEE1813790.1 hypothetical protein [Streptomyces sp. SP18ES09]